MLALAAALALVSGPAQSAEDARPRYSFVVAGHLRGNANGEIPREVEDLVSEIERLAPDLVFLTGDLIWGDIFNPGPQTDAEALRADWERLDASFARLSCPVYRVPGNHDISDATSRQVWTERYGELDRSFEFQGSRFLLLCSSWLPPGDGQERLPPSFVRGRQLTSEQVDFVRREMEAARDADHVFVLMHHLLWWKDPSPWWRDVHPLLAAGPTRAVFAGDLGPWKFSHLERDGIDYVQSTLELTLPVLRMRQNREGSRMISEQLDNYLYVSIDGPDVRIEVRTLGAVSNAKMTPAVYREVHEFDAGTFQSKVFKRVNTPERAVRWLAIAGCAGMGIGLAGGALLALLFTRRAR